MLGRSGCLLSVLWLARPTDSSAVYFFHIESPRSLSYSYEVQLSRNIGPRPETVYQRKRLVYANPPEACRPVTNCERTRGNVLLVERGECSFLTKVLEAEQAGAVIAIVTDSLHGDDEFIEMISDEGDKRTAHIPALYLPGRSGKVLRQHLLYSDEDILVTIPLNLSMKLLDEVKKPPWELW